MINHDNAEKVNAKKKMKNADQREEFLNMLRPSFSSSEILFFLSLSRISIQLISTNGMKKKREVLLSNQALLSSIASVGASGLS